jgi:hypothetical protein
MYKNNSRDSSNFKGCSPLQLSCDWTGKCHVVGYYFYTKRYFPIPFTQSTISSLVAGMAKWGSIWWSFTAERAYLMANHAEMASGRGGSPTALLFRMVF